MRTNNLTTHNCWRYYKISFCSRWVSSARICENYLLGYISAGRVLSNFVASSLTLWWHTYYTFPKYSPLIQHQYASSFEKCNSQEKFQIYFKMKVYFQNYLTMWVSFDSNGLRSRLLQSQFKRIYLAKFLLIFKLGWFIIMRGEFLLTVISSVTHLHLESWSSIELLFKITF